MNRTDFEKLYERYESASSEAWRWKLGKKLTDAIIDVINKLNSIHKELGIEPYSRVVDFKHFTFDEIVYDDYDDGDIAIGYFYPSFFSRGWGEDDNKYVRISLDLFDDDKLEKYRKDTINNRMKYLEDELTKYNIKISETTAELKRLKEYNI